MNNKGSWNPYFAGALSGVVAIGSVWFVENILERPLLL